MIQFDEKVRDFLIDLVIAPSLDRCSSRLGDRSSDVELRSSLCTIPSRFDCLKLEFPPSKVVAELKF